VSLVAVFGDICRSAIGQAEAQATGGPTPFKSGFSRPHRCEGADREDKVVFARRE
jgi:hypothetical protein